MPNIIPHKTIELYEACKTGDTERADELQKEIYSFAPLLTSSPTPHAMQKEAMRLLGHPIKPLVKPPLPRLTSDQAKLVRETLEYTGLL
jgi:dihydrodipicolinate synthase/N-acetylneuraminate lyase